MFLAVYESRTVHFPEGDVTVTRFPTDEYAATGENDEGVYKGFGDTPLAAIADYHAIEKKTLVVIKSRKVVGITTMRITQIGASIDGTSSRACQY